jgi:hypothetical protein
MPDPERFEQLEQEWRELRDSLKPERWAAIRSATRGVARPLALFAQLEDALVRWRQWRASGLLARFADRYVNPRWTLHDLLAHLASWAALLRLEAETVARGEEFQQFIPHALSGGGPSRWNGVEVEKRRGRALEEILDEFERETTRVQDLVMDLSVGTLAREAVFPVAYGADRNTCWRGTLAVAVAGATAHFRHHFDQIAARLAYFADHPDPTTTAAERARALQFWTAAREEFLRLVTPLSEEQWAFRPAPDRWSVREIAEHVVIVERYAHGLIEAALAGDPDPDWPAKAGAVTEGVCERILDRSRKGHAPPPMQPKGEWSGAEALRQYREARDKTREIIERFDLPLKAHLASGPPGTFNGYDWILLVSLHNQRHNQQIAEVLATEAQRHRE